jgi:lysozyme family protein
MGITQSTLAAWREREVTVDDVRNLTRAEADAILRANYYAVCRCGEMPERTAMVVYNGAVLHGPRRSIEFLQKAFNDLGMTADGAPLKVDGIVGTKTITAARQTDPTVLSDAYMNIQDAYFRAHDDFEHFGAGWMNRMASLREFVATLPQGAGLRPKTVMKVADSQARYLDLRRRPAREPCSFISRASGGPSRAWPRSRACRQLLALGDADLQLGDAAVVEIEHQRHQRHALAWRLVPEPRQSRLRDQQLAAAAFLVAEGLGLGVGGDVALISHSSPFSTLA